jgi:hypothetical protein
VAELTAAERACGWRLLYRTSLDDLPDGEIAWERNLWRAHGAAAVAAIGDDILTERRAACFALPGGADAEGLDLLLSRVNAAAALRAVRDEGMCLVDAMRLLYWAGLAEAPR